MGVRLLGGHEAVLVEQGSATKSEQQANRNPEEVQLMTEHMTVAEYHREIGFPDKQKAKAPAPKYKNQAVWLDGIRFDSVIEGAYYMLLEDEKRQGQLLYYLRQVPIRLPGNTTYWADFQVFLKNGEVQYIDTKGKETQIFRLKKRQVEDLYPIVIQCLSRNEIPKYYLTTARELADL